METNSIDEIVSVELSKLPFSPRPRQRLPFSTYHRNALLISLDLIFTFQPLIIIYLFKVRFAYVKILTYPTSWVRWFNNITLSLQILILPR
jgi:hypothetical protein